MNKKPFLANESVWFTLLFTLLIFFGCFAVFFVLSLLLAVPLFNVPLKEVISMTGDFNNPENLSLIRYIQVVQSIGLFIIPPVICSFLISKKPFRFLQFENKMSFLSIVFIGLTIIVSLPFINYLVLINEKMQLPAYLSNIERWMKQSEENAQHITELFLNTTTIRGLLFNIFMIGLLPAIGEEMTFRGVYQQLFIKAFKNHHIGIIITAFLFSAIHFQFYGFLARFVLGLYLGYLFVWTKNIWYPIVAHFINNSLAVVFYFLLQNGIINTNVDDIGVVNETGYMVILSCILLTVIIYTFKKFIPGQNFH